MNRIRRTEAICLRTQDRHESSKLVTLLTPDYGKLTVIAKGARRPKNKFGAALNLFARSRIIYYHHQQHATHTLSDAELVWSPAAITLVPERFLAAGQMTEFVLKALPHHDPNPRLYQLLATNLLVLSQAAAGYDLLTVAFLLKAASFLGFRPELGHCLVCHQSPKTGAVFAARRGGIICSECGAGTSDVDPLPLEQLTLLQKLLYTPSAAIPTLSPISPVTNLAPLIKNFLSHHFTPVVLNSLRWSASDPPLNKTGAP